MTVEYDQLAGTYGRYRRCNLDLLRELVDGGRLNRASRVLEVGAGTANYARALRELVHCDCTAVEPSVGMRDVAQEADRDLKVVPGTAENVPFDAASFDFVFCVDVVHHLSDQAALFREAFRVLAKHGLLCIVTDSEDMIRTRFPLAEYFPETVEVDLRRYPSVDRLREFASAAGFSGWRETRITTTAPLGSADAYEAKSFSVLHLISTAGFEMGVARLREDLKRGPLLAVGNYVLLWATK